MPRRAVHKTKHPGMRGGAHHRAPGSKSGPGPGTTKDRSCVTHVHISIREAPQTKRPTGGRGSDPLLASGRGLNPLLAGGLNPLLTGGLNPLLAGGLNPLFPGGLNPLVTSGKENGQGADEIVAIAASVDKLPVSSFWHTKDEGAAAKICNLTSRMRVVCRVAVVVGRMS